MRGSRARHRLWGLHASHLCARSGCAVWPGGHVDHAAVLQMRVVRVARVAHEAHVAREVRDRRRHGGRSHHRDVDGLGDRSLK